MEIQFILFVSNQEKSKQFYELLLNKQPILDVEGMTEFRLNKNTKLGLMPKKGIAKLLVDRENVLDVNEVPKCEIYIKVDDVLAWYNKSIELGAKKENSPKERDWGDFVGYVSDFDGNILAFAKQIKN